MRHCRHCGLSGHNKQTCLALKEYIKKNPESWEAKHSTSSNKLSNTTRKCSFCHQRGHNISTCEEHKDSKIQTILNNKKFRKYVINEFKKRKIGLGTMFMIKSEKWDPCSADVLLIVDEIRWHHINFHAMYRYSAICVTEHLVRNPFYDFEVTEHFFREIDEGAIKIVNEASDEFIAYNIPQNWESGVP